MTEKEIVSDEEVERVHGNADFGPHVTKREVLREGVLKRASGYYTGFTMASICKAHGLITDKTELLTQKGQKYLWAAFNHALKEGSQ